MTRVVVLGSQFAVGQFTLWCDSTMIQGGGLDRLWSSRDIRGVFSTKNIGAVMAWRVLSTDDGTWGVDPAVERRQSDAWRLVLAFRSLDEASNERRPTVWAPYPLEGQSQASLYARAEELDDRELIEVLSRSLAQEHSVQ